MGREGPRRNWPAGMYRDEDLVRIAVLIAWWSSYRQEFAAAPLGPASQDGLDTLRATAQAKLACLHEASLVLEMSQLVAADLTPGSQDELESQTR